MTRFWEIGRHTVNVDNVAAVERDWFDDNGTQREFYSVHLTSGKVFRAFDLKQVRAMLEEYMRPDRGPVGKEFVS